MWDTRVQIRVGSSAEGMDADVNNNTDISVDNEVTSISHRLLL